MGAEGLGPPPSVPVGDTGAVTPSTPTIASPSAPTTDFAAPAAPPIGDPGQTRFLTGEAVHLDVRVARLGSRVVARMIDFVLQIVLAFTLFIAMMILLGLATFAGLAVPEDPLVSAILVLVIVVSIIGYPIIMETVTRGRTFGKMILGLRVVRDDGGPVTYRQALARGLVGAAIEFPGLIPVVTGLATFPVMIASPQSKRLGDHVAGTVVIHERTPAAWGWVPRMPPELAGWAATLDLAGLDDNVALSVRQYLARNRQIREPARTQLGQLLAREVSAVTNPPPPPGVPGWAYLAAVHAERHRRSLRQLAAVRRRAAAVWPELVWNANPSPHAPTGYGSTSALPQ
jgi:uncharacterized RDD family membrane protein YckC